MLSPIQTRSHWISHLVFEPQENRIENPKYDAQFTIKYKKSDALWHVILSVKFGGKNPDEALYRGHIEFEGMFEVRPDFPEDKTEELVRMNGGAILYGAVRELVLNLTSRAKHGPFEMPTIDARMFLEMPMKKPAIDHIPEKQEK
jgi:preprotein translocase subunit SecB